MNRRHNRDKSLPPRFGPYGVAVWNDRAGCWSHHLTDDGQKLFDEFLGRWPNPCLVLCRRRPGLFAQYQRWDKADPGLMRRTGVLALWQAVLYYDPARGAALASILIYRLREEARTIGREYGGGWGKDVREGRSGAADHDFDTGDIPTLPLDLLDDRTRDAVEARFGIGRPEETCREYEARTGTSRQTYLNLVKRGLQILREGMTA